MKNLNKLSLTVALLCFVGTALFSGCRTHQNMGRVDSEKGSYPRRPGINYQRPHSDDPETQERLMKEWERKQAAARGDSIPNDTVRR